MHLDDISTIQVNAVLPSQGAINDTPTRNMIGRIWCFVFTMIKHCWHNT